MSSGGQRNPVRIAAPLAVVEPCQRVDNLPDFSEKEKILEWVVKNKINTVNGVGKVFVEYYNDREKVVGIVNKNQEPTTLVPKEWLKVM